MSQIPAHKGCDARLGAQLGHITIQIHPVNALQFQTTCSRWSSATLLLKFMARLRLGFCNSTIRRYRLLERQLSGSDAALLTRRRIEFLSFSRKMSARALSPTDATPSAT